MKNGWMVVVGLVLIVLLTVSLQESWGYECPATGSREARKIVGDILTKLSISAEERRNLPAACFLKEENDLQRRAETLLNLSRLLQNEVASYPCPLCLAIRSHELNAKQQQGAGAAKRKSADDDNDEGEEDEGQSKKVSLEDIQVHQLKLGGQQKGGLGGFWSESLLDKHLWQRHYEQVGRNSSSEVCLADFCEILGCPSAFASASHAGASTFDPCDPSFVKLQQTVCRDTFAQCFAPESDPLTLNRFAVITDQYCVNRACQSAAAFRSPGALAYSLSYPADPASAPATTHSLVPRLLRFLFSQGSFLFYLLIVVFVVLFYQLVWKRKTVLQAQRDFRSLRSPSSSIFASFFSSFKKKASLE